VPDAGEQLPAVLGLLRPGQRRVQVGEVTDPGWSAGDQAGHLQGVVDGEERGARMRHGTSHGGLSQSQALVQRLADPDYPGQDVVAQLLLSRYRAGLSAAG